MRSYLKFSDEKIEKRGVFQMRMEKKIRMKKEYVLC